MNLSEIEKSLNDDAGKASAIWITFITFELYLLIAFGSITSRDLLLETTLKLPLLGTELPLLGFSQIAPALLVIFHFYLILQFALLAEKLAAYESALHKELPFKADQEQARLRLSFFFRTQLSSGTTLQRQGIIGISLKAIAWLTLVAAPITILLQALLTFLPYHNQQQVWTIRCLIAIDALLIVYFWSALVGHGHHRSPLNKLTGLAVQIANASILLAVLAFSVLLATYPGEQFVEKLPYRMKINAWRGYLFGGPIDEVTGRPRSYFTNRIVVTDQILVSDQQGKINPLKSFRGRDLRDAVFTRADLRNADFTGAMLNGAVFSDAQLQQANFGCRDTGISAQASWDERASWPDDGCTWLQKTDFSSANLQRASFFYAHAESADFSHADLSDAEFAFVKIDGSAFYSSTLAGTAIRRSFARGATFYEADLTAASLFDSDFTGSILERSRLHGAYLTRVNLEGSSLFNARLQGAAFSDGSLRGALLAGAQVWRTKWAPSLPPAIEGTNRTRIDTKTTPWEDEVDPKRKSYADWRKAVVGSLKSAESSDTIELLTALDPKRRASPSSDFLGFLEKQEPRFDVEKQLSVLGELFCSDSGSGSVPSRVSSMILTLYKERLISAEKYRDNVAKLRGGAKQEICVGATGLDGEFWDQLDNPDATIVNPTRPVGRVPK